MSEHGPKIEYEKTDADLKAVTKVGVGIAVLATVVALALRPIMSGMVAQQAKSDVAPPPIAGFDPARQAPEPRLQREPFADWRALHARQEAVLTSYGWVDEPAGVTHIPIDQAMKLLVARGVPARDQEMTIQPTAADPAPVSPAPGGGHR